ncbi:hypothetical protein [Flavobacterium muglaense]|uniref:Fibronectin type-III domain-containing protein n=1 Tax=Flavobacterium muglaense TaxID=2764716 RepID=A0A923MYJ3_9FLAO|nr:hypothetical protein [Flavobacterium muglaense]MBC5837539.1 hypothetical protein [Flavobacterium muglaense]MBC5844044.1 hypothetical protein [Flavobacterium muglaense]
MKNYILLVISFYCLCLRAQTPSITINLPPNPNPDTSQWGSGSSIFNILVAGNNMNLLFDSTVLVNIKSNGVVRCGGTSSSSAQSSNISTISPKSWIGTSAQALLGQDCILTPGSYEICIQFYSGRNGVTSDKNLLEKCMPFTILNKEQEVCSPPINVNPATNKIFVEKDLLSLITFNWSPIISSYRGIVTYRIFVWEIEEGETYSQAIYSNLPIIQEDVKGQPKYIAKSGIIEKRNAKYVWRVIALDSDGDPICKKTQSEPTVFEVKIPEKQNNLNTPCGNGDFESSIIDPTEWSGGYTQLSGGNNYTFSPPFNSIIKPANGNPIDATINTGCGSQAAENHQVIVSAGFDGNIPTLNRVPPSIIPNKYALRLGNNCPGCGTERMQKKFVVPAGTTDYKFMYALVFEAPHTLTDNPSLWVRVYDSTNTLITGIVYLDPFSSLPMDRAISDLTNPYWKTYNGFLYRDWACARIDLSKLVGQTITVEILTNDCAHCGHWGYGYFDNFCVGCDNNPPNKECCTEKIEAVKNTVNVSTLNIMTLTQDFSISPKNIKKVTAEIISFEEDLVTTSCMKCVTKENWVGNFIGTNTESWNSGTPMNGSPVNSDGYYPAKMVEWNCNKQGSLSLVFKIAVPGSETGCTRKGKVGIRYTFTDIDCVSCEKIIYYNYTSK